MDRFSKIAVWLIFQKEALPSRAWKASAVESSEVLFPRQKKGEESSDVCWKDDWQLFNWRLMTDQHKHEEQRHSHAAVTKCTSQTAKVRCGLPDLWLTEGLCLYISSSMLKATVSPSWQSFLLSYYILHTSACSKPQWWIIQDIRKCAKIWQKDIVYFSNL